MASNSNLLIVVYTLTHAHAHWSTHVHSLLKIQNTRAHTYILYISTNFQHRSRFRYWWKLKSVHQNQRTWCACYVDARKLEYFASPIIGLWRGRNSGYLFMCNTIREQNIRVEETLIRLSLSLSLSMQLFISRPIIHFYLPLTTCIEYEYNNYWIFLS